MNPAIIVAVVIILIFIVFAKVVYPKIISKKNIDFSDKAKIFLDNEKISYNDEQIVYAEHKKSIGSSIMQTGKQLMLGIVGVQDYTDFAKYVIIYNNKHIVFIPVCISEFSGNIILCEENNEFVTDIDIFDISDIKIDNDTVTFNIGNNQKTIFIPNKTLPYREQEHLKKNFLEFAENIKKLL